MSGEVKRIVTHPPPSSFVATDLVEELLAGTPNERGFVQFMSADKKAECGVWACDSYTEHIPSYPGDELFVVIEGSAILTVDGEESETFSPGDAFVIRDGTPCTLQVHGPFLKYWMTYHA